MKPRRPGSEPPAGSVWDGRLREVPLVFVDLEMTGLDEKRDRVLQLCLERVVGDETVDQLTSYVDPEGATGNAEVHGIGPELLVGAPRFADLARRILALLDGAILVAHGAVYDIAFLRAELARCGIAWDSPFHVDTLHLSRRAFNFKSHRLAVLARELEIPCPSAHRADNDVRVLRTLFERVVSVLGPNTPRDLWHVRVGLGHARPEVLLGLERALVDGTPLRLRYRPAGRAVQEIPFHVTSMRTDLDPPMVIGYLSHTRGRRELRIDRILSLEPQASTGSPS
ncbi:MAG: 3'-5' exonuclease [Deltaproteobacteria bacterium]|nr:3'-5' exonuclease [Deltaproteobacteria bacterium]